MLLNSDEFNPRRSPIKDIIYMERGKRLIDPEMIEDWNQLIKQCSNQYLDYDVEFTLALDFLEMVQAGVKVEEAVSIFADSVDREVNLHRISPLQGCITRDIVATFSSFGPEFATMIPETSFLHLDAKHIRNLDTKYIQKKMD